MQLDLDMNLIKHLLAMQVTNFYAVSSRYGTPNDFKRLVDEAHGCILFLMPFILLTHFKYFVDAFSNG
jgi:glycosidase